MIKNIYNGQRRLIVMLNKIKLYGRLARFIGERSFEAEVKTPAQALIFQN
jgi:predicted phage tail protein